MNRFKITPGREHDFEAIWRNRETNLGSVPGFIGFHLVKKLTSRGSYSSGAYPTHPGVTTLPSVMKIRSVPASQSGLAPHSRATSIVATPVTTQMPLSPCFVQKVTSRSASAATARPQRGRRGRFNVLSGELTNYI